MLKQAFDNLKLTRFGFWVCGKSLGISAEQFALPPVNTQNAKGYLPYMLFRNVYACEMLTL